MLQICLLGELRVTDDDVLANRINTPRLYSLLAYLLIHRDTPQYRRDLAFMLWPDSSEAQARTNLRKLLYQLRQVLPDADEHLHFEGQMVQWQPGRGYTLDVEAFLAAVEAARQDPGKEMHHLERAAGLYQGNLLPGCYDDWIEPERERLRNQFTGVLERLIALNEAKRSYAKALGDARRLVQLDELNENAYRHLMRLHALAGDRAGALRVYHSCVTTFLRELAVQPGKEMRELYERLLQDERPEPGLKAAGRLAGEAVRGMPPLVGREQQWQILQQSWQKAAAGKPCCLVISGEAGIGKTRLAEELLGWIHRQGYLTASARCFEAEGNMTYGPVADWLRSDVLHPHLKSLDHVWQVEIARLVPELQAERPDLPPPGALNEDWQRRRLFDALLRAVSQVQSPAIVLFLDDLQWCDGPTLSWMHYLLRSVLPVRLLLVCTLRVEELTTQHPVEQWLEGLRYSGCLEEVELGPLSAAETAELAAYVSGKVLDPASAANLFADTEGHPLFVIESVRMAVERVFKRDSRPEGGQWASPTVQAVITHRLAQLSPAARDLAGIAAIIGRSFSYPVLAKVSTGADEGSLVRSLDELWQRRIIREQGSNGYDFSHDKIREASYQGMSAARRRLLHRQVGEILVASIGGQGTPGQMLSPGDLVRQVAAHFDRAGLPEMAIPYYHQAAEQARQLFANDEALQSYQRALELLASASVPDVDLAVEIGEAYGDLLLLMTRRGEARAVV
jgi:DNA-binding SARP family transcriptional activator